MSSALLIVATVLVLGFAAFAIGHRIHTEATGAKRLTVIAGLAAGCAVGLQGAGEDPTVHAIAWGFTAVLTALAAYARWRDRERRRLTRPNEI
jgi:hypothetical protein